MNIVERTEYIEELKKRKDLMLKGKNCYKEIINIMW